MKTDKLERKRKSEAVYRAFQATATRRAKIAAEFREKLVLEVGENNLSASRLALIDSCVSAYVMTSELSTLFLAGRANPQQVGQLSISRGQLSRCLRSLGVIDRTSAEVEAVPSVDELLAPFRKAKEIDAQQDPVPADQ